MSRMAVPAMLLLPLVVVAVSIFSPGASTSRGAPESEVRILGQHARLKAKLARCLSEPTDAGQFHRRIRTTDPFTLPGLLVMEELIHAESLRSSSLPRGTSDFRYVSFIDSRPIKLQIEKVAGLHGPSERGKAAPGWCTLCATSVVATQVSKVLMDLVVGQHVDYQRFL